MADRYFLNVTTNFNSILNWSTTSGGLPGASVPVSTDRVILDANSGNLSLEININVRGIISTGYLNNLTQNAFTITVGSFNFSWVNGTFIGSSSAITCTGSLLVTGGTFTNTSGLCTISISFTSQGTYSHNNGSVLFLSNNHVTVTSGIFYNLEIAKGSFNIIILISNAIVNNNLILTSAGSASGLNIECKKDIQFNSTGAGSSIRIIVNGTGNQNISGAGNCITNLDINKPSGTLFFLSNIIFKGDYKVLSGTVNWGTFTAEFSNSFTSAIENGNFYNLTFNSGSFTINIAVSNLIVNNTLTFLNIAVLTGLAIEAKGDVIVTDISFSFSGGLILNGTGNQNISGAGSCPSDITLNKPSGICFLTSNFSISGSSKDFNLINGVFDQNGFNFVIPDTLNQTGGTYNQGAGTLDLFRYVSALGTFNEGSQGIICRGAYFIVGISAIFNRSLIGGGLFANTAVGTALLLTVNGWTLSNLTFARLTASLTLGSSLNINGYYKKSSTATTANVIGAGFMVRIGGNVEQNNLYSSRVLATSPTFIFNGVSDQTVTASDGKLDSGIWQVNKPSGKVSQLSNITIDNGQAGDNGLNNLVALSGAWCTNNFNLTVDGSIIILSVAELRKTPLSVITGTIAGVVTNVNSCDEKKTAFFLVE
jgi:hypothetical protein